MMLSRFYLGSRLLCSPLEALYTILIFILSKELDVALWNLTLMACIKPVISLLSFYISSFVVSKPGKVKRYLLLLNTVGLAPCLLFPWMENPLFFIAAYALFLTTQRGAFPVWGELLKKNIELSSMSKLVSKGTIINYASIMVFPFLFSYWLDQSAGVWKWLFVGLASLQMVNTVLLLFLPAAFIYEKAAPPQVMVSPLRLLRENPAFGRYLWLFFLGGAGIVAMQPILPMFFKETLGLSYAQLTLAFSFCKGIAFLSTSSYWAKFISIFRLNAYMNLLTSIYFISILLSPLNLSWLYFGYLVYGAMQAGCELSWNLSGPIFSKNNESTFYSSMNLALSGIRGCICPLLGQLIFSFTNAQTLLICCVIVCLFSLFYALSLDRRYKEAAV